MEEGQCNWCEAVSCPVDRPSRPPAAPRWPNPSAPASESARPARFQKLGTGASQRTIITGIDEIIELVKGGMSEALVIQTIQRQGKAYDLTPADLVKLQKAGVSEKIMEALLGPATAPGATAAPAAAAPVAPAAKAPAQAVEPAPQQSRTQMNAAAQQQAAERQRQNQERAEKYNACRQQVLKDHPGGGGDLVKAFTSCVQALQAK